MRTERKEEVKIKLREREVRQTGCKRNQIVDEKGIERMVEKVE